MQNSRWLAIYVDQHGKPRAAMLTVPGEAEFPFGVDEFALGLADYDGEPVTLIEMPGDDAFRPTVVDNNDDAELPLQFIDI